MAIPMEQTTRRGHRHRQMKTGLVPVVLKTDLTTALPSVTTADLDLSIWQIAPDTLNVEHLPVLLRTVHKQVRMLALDARGCRIVQRTLELAHGESQLGMIAELKGHVCEMMQSPYGNYVLQICINVMRPSVVKFIMSELSHCYKPAAIARHKFGCRVLERLIEHFHPDELQDFLAEILADASRLCKHVYGNFVMQHILEHGTHIQRKQVIACLHEDLVGISVSNSACCVLDMALTYSEVRDQENLATAILGQSLLSAMVQHHGGIRATQRLMRVVRNGPLFLEARRQLRDVMSRMRFRYARVLMEWVSVQ